MTNNPALSPDQASNSPRCKHCDGPIPGGDRRPREYCSNACRQADHRSRQARAAPEKAPEAHLARQNGSTAESSKIGVENLNQINGRNFVTNGPSLPLNLFGRGYRWPGAATSIRTAKVSAAVDAELGVGGLVVVSPDGVAMAIVPSRKPRSSSAVLS